MRLTSSFFFLNFGNENIGIITAIYPTVMGIEATLLQREKCLIHYSKKSNAFFWRNVIARLSYFLISI